MRSRNASSDPAVCSASATVASLADWITIALSSSSTVITSPTSSQISEPPMELANALVVTCCSSVSSPRSMASMNNRIDMIFVTDPHARRSWAFCSYSTVPVVPSIRIADLAGTSPNSAHAGTHRAHPVIHTASIAAANCRIRLIDCIPLLPIRLTVFGLFICGQAEIMRGMRRFRRRCAAVRRGTGRVRCRFDR